MVIVLVLAAVAVHAVVRSLPTLEYDEVGKGCRGAVVAFMAMVFAAVFVSTAMVSSVAWVLYLIGDYVSFMPSYSGVEAFASAAFFWLLAVYVKGVVRGCREDVDVS